MRLLLPGLLLLPLTLAAQGPRTCAVVIDSTGGQWRRVPAGNDRFRVYANGGVWAHCRNESTRMFADSAAYYPEYNRFDMVGRVRFRDSTALLTAQRASYLLRDEQLDAHGDVTLTNQRTGSRLRGPTLSYRRQAEGVRDTARMDACGRPTVEYRAARDTATEPYLIIADCLWLTGDDRAEARGTVMIDRSDFRARGDSALLDGAADAGALVGHAAVAGDSAAYTLSGRRVDYRLTEDAITWARASGRADATSAEWRLEADTIEFDVTDDQIQGGRAWGDSLRAAARSALRVITADSLAILTPGQRLEAVRAYGAALAVTALDSLDTERDWVAGDTVLAIFADDHTLARLEAAVGASTRYRVFEGIGAARILRGINYARGDRILARFAEDQLERVDVSGNADGVYLEAPEPARGTR